MERWQLRFPLCLEHQAALHLVVAPILSLFYLLPGTSLPFWELQCTYNLMVWLNSWLVR